MISRDAILHASLIPGIGDVAIGKVCSALGLDRSGDIYQLSSRDFVERCGLSFTQAELLARGLADRSVLEGEIALLERHGVCWTTFVDGDYPEILKTVYAPPAVLFWRGVAPCSFSQVLACVGSRAAKRYAHAVIHHIVPELIAAGCAIVSGGALGADTMVHEATLAVGGQTIAVIGSGLLKPYPATNRRLFERIVASGGCVVSIFPSQMQAVPGNFPARNRVIAGLARAVVVIQAAEKSGARITALQALEQGREVCAIPGDIFDPLSAGCHRLIGEGATPVTCAADILRACGCEHIGVSVTEAVSTNVNQSGDSLVQLCQEGRTFDELLEQGGYGFGELQERLFNLQLDGVLVQDFLGRWTVTR